MGRPRRHAHRDLTAPSVTPGFDIRPFQDDDYAAVEALWDACGLNVPWNDPASDIARCRQAANASLLVGVAEGVPVATVMVGHDGHRGWLYYLAVAPARARQGFGRRMVLHAEEWLTAQGMPKVQLMIRADNAEVGGFYEKLGYDQIPRLVMERWLVDAPGKTRRPR